MRRDWGSPPVPWYAKRRSRGDTLSTNPVARKRLAEFFARTGSLYGTRSGADADAQRPDPGESTEVIDTTTTQEELSERERLHAEFCFTRAEVATFLGVSKVRVEQIEKGALSKCRQIFRILENYQDEEEAAEAILRVCGRRWDMKAKRLVTVPGRLYRHPGRIT